MNEVNKTLYIPLYGKAYVSRRGLFLRDKKAEAIWAAEGFKLRGKAKSKWLAYYMGIRAAVFDRWVLARQKEYPDAVVLHLGCGMDSRVLRVNGDGQRWYDVDFPQVIAARKTHYRERDNYRMLAGDLRQPDWLEQIPETGRAIVVMEGVSMYLSPGELDGLLRGLCGHFAGVSLLLDGYTPLAAKLSGYRNPIRQVGVRTVYGLDDPLRLQESGLSFLREHPMTPESDICQLQGMERIIFKHLYAGRFSQKLYRLLEYTTP